MTFGTDVRDDTRLLIDGELKSTFTLTPITPSNSNFGYSGVSESEGGTSTVNCVPTQYVQNRTGLEKFGDLEEGEVRLAIRDDQTIDTNDKVTFDGTDYFVRDIKPVRLNDVDVMQVILLSKRQ